MSIGLIFIVVIVFILVSSIMRRDGHGKQAGSKRSNDGDAAMFAASNPELFDTTQDRESPSHGHKHHSDHGDNGWNNSHSHHSGSGHGHSDFGGHSHGGHSFGDSGGHSGGGDGGGGGDAGGGGGD